ncbi:SIMPL domain-containing protein [Pseudalkalibacillus salsuginis]|uniref:SIMPL domain-containing protein n=1 Tax=Pseudalkalibacillus salsuginis TaxID=2910972 RepID=UPI001F38EA2A|nr:SIMPL domain-containing protein [Pseudalkalibacillus salsuginis]MCF6408187.1 SIMPL domain-containing protein [Pseudalkalibacillus salsuginis]
MNRSYPFPQRDENIETSKPVMEVYGDGELTIDADEISLTIGVITEDPDVKTASAENARRSNQVLNALLNLGIPSNQIETVVYTIQPIYAYENGQSIFKGFRVEHLYRVMINDVRSAGSVYDTAIRNGANFARDISFDVSNPKAFYLKALTIAYQDGIRKAVTLAQQMGVRLNQVPIKVVELKEREVVPLYKTQLLQSAGPTPIQPQKVTITAQMKIWFCYSS